MYKNVAKLLTCLKTLVSVCCSLFIRHRGKSYFLDKIVTSNEKWIYYENENQIKSYWDQKQPSPSNVRLDLKGTLYYCLCNQPNIICCNLIKVY